MSNYSGECQLNTLLIAQGQRAADISCRYWFPEVPMTAEPEDFSPSACLCLWRQHLFLSPHADTDAEDDQELTPFFYIKMDCQRKPMNLI